MISDAVHVLDDMILEEEGEDDRRSSLRFDRTVPRELVHKASVADVFLTDTMAVGEDRVLVAAQWGRSHVFYRPDVFDCADPLLLIETVRQAAIYLAHAHFGVDMSQQFIFTTLEVSLNDHEFTRFFGGPVRGVLDCTYTRFEKRGKAGATVDCVIEVAGRPVGHARAGFLTVGTPLYEVLRNRSAGRESVTAPRRAYMMTGARVGRALQGDVLVGRSGGDLVLRMDPAHPAYFEHGSDHIPGMVLIEAFRQVGYSVLRDSQPRPTGKPLQLWLSRMTTAFLSFGELDDEVLLRVEGQAGTSDGGGLEIVAVQSGVTVAKGSVAFVPAQIR